MTLIIALLLGIMLIAAACAPSSSEDSGPEDLLQTLTAAADTIRSSDTFRIYVIQQGAPYLFQIRLADGLAEVSFRNAEAQYVSPETVQARASVRFGGLTLDIDIFAQGEDQWFRLPGAPWISGAFAQGFNPATLVADDSGFEAALSSLRELEFIASESLEDGQPVWHIRGVATGSAVADLVVGLLDIEGDVPVDVYINRENGYVVRLALTQVGTATEEAPDTVWIIDVYDVNAEPALDPPTDAADTSSSGVTSTLDAVPSSDNNADEE